MLQKKQTILVISHNAFNPCQNNGKTLKSFFADYSKAQLAQLFLQPEQPDFSICERYFRMTDYEALNSCLNRSAIGHEVRESTLNDDYLHQLSPMIRRLHSLLRPARPSAVIPRFVKQGFLDRQPAFTAVRELIWFFAKWRSEKLTYWISAIKPDVVFFQGSSCTFAYKLVEWICANYELPLILQLTDDYTKRYPKYSLLSWLLVHRYRRALAKAVRRAQAVITISDSMLEEYSKRWPGNYVTLMNAVEPRNCRPEPTSEQGLKLIYAGNVGIGRWTVLKRIGESLAEINQKHGVNHKLTIHSPTVIDSYIERELLGAGAIAVGSQLGPDELELAIGEANIVVHVESFDSRMRLITRLSISTKIPEYMASARCILAVGPPEIASIKYLSDHRAAKVVSSQELPAVKRALIQLLSDASERKVFADRALECFLQTHTLARNKKIISELIAGTLTLPRDINLP